MSEIRLAQKGEEVQQKDIWKFSFGDSKDFIDFFYKHQYQEDQTMLLLQGGQVSAMLTMLPVNIMTPDFNSFDAAMLYGIATHPQYRRRGYAAQLMNYSHHFLTEKDRIFSVLVPAEEKLFDFYRKQGYENGFYIREVNITKEKIKTLSQYNCCSGRIFTISSHEYNLRRNYQLRGSFFISYGVEQINYQKKLSQLSGCDLYGIDIKGVKGCAACERINEDKIIIKEILISDQLISLAVRLLSEILSAEDYILRTPAFFGNKLEGSIRPFAMIRTNGGEEKLNIKPKDLGYLGLAFD